MAKIFISYTTPDKPLTDALVKLLQAALRLQDDELTFSGRRATGVRVAARFEQALRTAVHTNDLVIAVISPRTFKSPFQMLEIGAAWVREQPKDEPIMAIALPRSADKEDLPKPLDDFEAAALDTADDVKALVRWAGERLQREPQPLEEWQAHLDNVMSVARISSVQRRVERVAHAVMPLTPWLIIAVITLFYLSTSFSLRSQFLMDDGITPRPGCVYLDGGDLQMTNERGWADFSFTSGMPGKRRVRFEPGTPPDPCDIKAGSEVEWIAPMPFARQARFHFNQQQRRLVVAEQTIAPMLGGWDLAVSAAGATREAAQEPQFYEVGILLDAIRLDAMPAILGVFRRPSRAYFRVTINGNAIPDNQLLSPSPLTVPKGVSYFPVRSVPESWMPVNDGPERKLNGFLCRIPTQHISQISADDKLTLQGSVKLTLIGDTGVTIAEFDITPAFAGRIWTSTKIAAVDGRGELTIRPVVNVRADFDIQWPDTISAIVGEPTTVAARLHREDTRAEIAAPFAIGVSLTLENGLQSKGALRPLLFSKGESTKEAVFTPSSEGTGTIVSRMPKSLGGSRDDVSVVVRRTKRTRIF